MSTIGRDYFALLAEGHVPAIDGNGNVDLTPDFVVPKSSLAQAVFIAPAVGVSYSSVITFAGAYAIGDEITVTVKGGPESPQKWSKIYKHVVEAGATSVTAIAAVFASKMQTDGANDAPYTAASVAGVLTVTLKEDDSKALSVEEWTNSSAGTVVAAVATGTISEGQPQDLIDRGVPAENINLASYDTVKITYDAEAPVASIDTKDRRAREIYWYGDPGTGANLATLINS